MSELQILEKLIISMEQKNYKQFGELFAKLPKNTQIEIEEMLKK